MAPISAAVLLLAVAEAVIAMAALQLSGAAAAVAAPALPSIGQPGCNTTCGDVSVPYPFGLGPSHCYWPGLNLTCDTFYQTPRLLLGDGSLQVVEISLQNQTVRVMRVRTDYIIDNSRLTSSPGGWNTSFEFGRGFREHGYLLSNQNVLIVEGCNIMATLSGDILGEETTKIVGGCASLCTEVDDDYGVAFIDEHNSGNETNIACTGTSGCCQAPLSSSSVPKGLQARWVFGEEPNMSVSVYVADQGWPGRFNGSGVPLLLDFRLIQDLPPPPELERNHLDCTQEVNRMACKSEHSFCSAMAQGYTCHCEDGYDGNPYLAGGCQDVDECKIPAIRNSCLGGYCKNLPGHYECRCPRGTHGNASELHGCVFKFSTGLTIGLSVASGPTLLLVLGIMFLLRKCKQHRIKVQKQKYFKQNRGQLLQQLVSQKADIAERMIIPMDELAKATNYFDRAREIGGGGHGTVYKGILSDLHVVAIKKSKITMQKEIDEFINEVAILSQINHKNVVKLFGCCLETEVPLLVYESILNGTLYHHLHSEGQERSLSWCNRLRIATEIATSLAYLHSSVSIPIIHRDIKSSNILLDDTMTSKISDFGASRYIPIDNTWLTTRIQGTFGYLDPECFQTGRLTEKSDVYSFGVILVELLTRKKPIDSQLSDEYGGLVPHFRNLLASRNLVQIMDPQVLEEGGKEVEQVVMLATSCINKRGEKRPTMRQVEHTLEGLQQCSSQKYKKNDTVTRELEIGSIGESYHSWTSEGQRFEESSRRYSLEQEMMMSARYPR